MHSISIKCSSPGNPCCISPVDCDTCNTGTTPNAFLVTLPNAFTDNPAGGCNNCDLLNGSSFVLFQDLGLAADGCQFDLDGDGGNVGVPCATPTCCYFVIVLEIGFDFIRVDIQSGPEPFGSAYGTIEWQSDTFSGPIDCTTVDNLECFYVSTPFGCTFTGGSVFVTALG